MSAAVRDVSPWHDPVWRVNNLYSITNKAGEVVPFRPNWAQQELLEGLSRRSIVLKARQLGMSTLIGIMQLDHCLFNENQTAVTIAHERTALEGLFERNVRAVYERLPASMREECPAFRDRTHQLTFGNGSSISVSLSSRSGTVQFLHVSEFGKLCAKYPQKAKEVVTGAFESVPERGVIVIESTAEGQSGYFHDYCMDAYRAKQEGRVPGWKLFFFPWHRHPEYQSSEPTVIHDPTRKYFAGLAERGIEVNRKQQSWYQRKVASLGDDIKREHPSFVEEAFEASTEGAYYVDQMARARKEDRITKVPYQAGHPVETYWDLGMRDSTTIWFVQRVGREIRLIDYYEASGEPLQHYAEVLLEKRQAWGCIYSRHVAPHDIKVRSLSSGVTRLETAQRLGIDFEVCPTHPVSERIDAVRNGLSICWFDAERTQPGIKALDSYRKEWDEVRGTWRDKPLHDWASHASDSFGLIFMADPVINSRPQARPVQPARW